MARGEEKKDSGSDYHSNENGSMLPVSSIGAHHVYIKHDNHGWVPARLVSLDKKKQEATVAVDEFPDEQAMLMTSAWAGDYRRRNGENGEIANHTFVVDTSSYDGGFLPPQNTTDEGELVEYEDMVDMPYLHEVSSSSVACFFFVLLRLLVFVLLIYFLLHIIICLPDIGAPIHFNFFSCT